MTRGHPDLGGNNTSVTLVLPPQGRAVSVTCFIMHSHIVPSKSGGVGLVSHKKAVAEAEGAGTQQGRAAVRGVGETQTFFLDGTGR